MTAGSTHGEAITVQRYVVSWAWFSYATERISLTISYLFKSYEVFSNVVFWNKNERNFYQDITL